MIIKDSKTFKLLLQNLQKFTSKQTKIDALSYVKFSTTEGSSILTAEFSNLIDFPSNTVQFYYTTSIELAVPATFTTTFFLHLSELKRLTSEMVSTSKVHIETEGFVLSGIGLKFFNSKRFSADEFPNFQQPTLEWIPAPENFRLDLANAEKFVNPKEHRQIICGTWWYNQDNKFSIFGTDGHIAYFHTFQEQVNFTPFIVPVISKFVTGEVSTIGISEKTLQLVGQDFTFTVRLPQVQTLKFWDMQYSTPEYIIFTPEILEKLPRKTEKFYLEQLENGMTEFRETFEPANAAWKFEAEVTCTVKDYVIGINWNELQVIVKLLGNFRELQLNFNPISISRLNKVMINASTPLIINDGQRKFYSMAIKTYRDSDD